MLVEGETETASHFERQRWDTVSARTLNRKARPVIWLDSGSQFPLSDPGGKYIPFWTQIPGRSFRDVRSPYTLTTSAHKKTREGTRPSLVTGTM